MSTYILSSEELREIIIGKAQYRKCPACDSKGLELAAYDFAGNPCHNDHEEAQHFPCDACNGLGYLKVPQE